MTIQEITGLPEVEFNEPLFNLLPDETFTVMLLDEEAIECRLIIDENEWPISLALRTGKGWKATNFVLRGPTLEAVERFEELEGEIVMTTQKDWMRATREYYSLKLMQTVPPTVESHSPQRMNTVRALLTEVWGDREGATCLDCGCGSGMGSMVLREMGIEPVAYDNDDTLLSLGLGRGRLLPPETMLIDATLARYYVPPAELGMALMAGTINDFTSLIWKAILHELMDLSAETLITVESAKEAELVRLWGVGEGKKVKVFENKQDAFYDRWACLVTE
jgi:hypothetical protein